MSPTLESWVVDCLAVVRHHASLIVVMDALNSFVAMSARLAS